MQDISSFGWINRLHFSTEIQDKKWNRTPRDIWRELICLPRRDCSVPSSVDAMSLSLSSPLPLSFHDCAVFSNTYNLHCIWGGRRRVAMFSSYCNTCLTQQHVCVCARLWERACRLPVKRCFPLPLQSWRWPSLRCTSWLWLWCRLLQTLPKTPTQCSLPGVKVMGQFELIRKEQVFFFSFCLHFMQQGSLNQSVTAFC